MTSLWEVLSLELWLHSHKQPPVVLLPLPHAPSTLTDFRSPLSLSNPTVPWIESAAPTELSDSSSLESREVVEHRYLTIVFKACFNNRRYSGRRLLLEWDFTAAQTLQ